MYNQLFMRSLCLCMCLCFVLHVVCVSAYFIMKGLATWDKSTDSDRQQGMIVEETLSNLNFDPFTFRILKANGTMPLYATKICVELVAL